MKISDHQNEELEEKYQKLREFVDTKIKEQVSIHDRMVIRYYKMIDKCKNYDEHFERIQTENCRVKLIIQYLMHKVRELFGCSSIEKHLTRSNDVLFVEVSHTGASIFNFLYLLSVGVDFKRIRFSDVFF